MNSSPDITCLLPVKHITEDVFNIYNDLLYQLIGHSIKLTENPIRQWGSCIVPSKPVKVTPKEIDAIKARSVGAPQGTTEWLTERMKFLTASIIAVALGIKGPAARKKLIEEKATKKSTFVGGAATHWGNLFEYVVIMIYEDMYSVTVYDLGLIKHKVHDFLAASSDGLSSDGINLEIKCPPSRTIDGRIPIQYWNQMQLQMSVLNVPMSHFIECRFEQWDYTDHDLRRFQKRDHPHHYGWFDEWVDTITGDLKYSYGMITQDILKQSIPESPYWKWPAPAPSKPECDNKLIWLRRCGWSLEQILVQNIEIDTDWIDYVYPILNKFWEEVLYYREHPDKLPTDTKRRRKHI